MAKRAKCPKTITVTKRKAGGWSFKSPLTGKMHVRRSAVDALDQAKAAARVVEKRSLRRRGRKCSPKVQIRSGGKGSLAFRHY